MALSLLLAIHQSMAASLLRALDAVALATNVTVIMKCGTKRHRIQEKIMHRVYLATFVSALLAFSSCAPDSGIETEKTKSAALKRRVIFNGDSAVLMHPLASTLEGFVTPRLEALVGTAVTTISWSVLAGDAPSYDSRVQPIYGDAQSGMPDDMVVYSSNLKTLIRDGTCPLKIVTDFAHENDLESFASVRMNDVHDSFIEGHLSRWKAAHRDRLVSSRGLQTGANHPFETIEQPASPGSRIANLYVSALDFSHQVVRDRKFEIIEEVCLRYDIDGVELDFIRHPVLFKSLFEGEGITEEQVALFTSFIRRIRRRMDEIGEARGRPLLLSARTPDDLQLSLGIGLDLRTWMEEALLDMLILGGGYAPFGLPVQQVTEIAHSYGVPVYPCINNPGQLMDGQGVEVTRALATKWYAAGADGIYFWNLASPWEQIFDEADWRPLRQQVYACLEDIDNLIALESKEKVYWATQAVWFPYAFVSSKGQLPIRLENGTERKVPIVVGDDVEKLSREGKLGSVELTLDLEGRVSSSDEISLRLNGMGLPGGELTVSDPEKASFQIKIGLKRSGLRQGENLVGVLLRSDASAPNRPPSVTRLKLRLSPINGLET